MLSLDRRPALVVLALGIASGACTGRREPRNEGANVLLISLDSVRRDVLSCYGYEAPFAPGERTTPNLDRLAAEGVLFEDAYATTSWTLPSHHTLFSGLPELVHAVELDSQRPADGIPNLAEALKRQGWRTAGFYSGPYLDPRFGFARGFERYEACYGSELESAAKRQAEILERLLGTAQDSPALAALLSERAEAERELEVASHRDSSSERVSDAVIAELERAANSGRPFFLFAHYFDPHYDYVPPEPFAKRFDPAYEGALDGRDFYTGAKVAAFDATLPSGRRRAVSDRELEHVRALYAGEIAWTDSQIGRVLQRLDELDLDEQTLVIVVSDHGDEFFEHGGIGHRRTLYEEVVRVPLILRFTGILPEGARIQGPVTVADIGDTVHEVVELPRSVDGRSRDSLSLLEAIRSGTSSRTLLGRLVRFEPLQVRAGSAGEPAVWGQRVIVTETYRKGPIKVTRTKAWARAGEELYAQARATFRQTTAALDSEELRWIDLERDPEEREENHSTDFSDSRARAALQEFHDVYGELAKLRSETHESRTPEEVVALLRGLGYFGSESWVVGDSELILPPPGAQVLSEKR